MTSPEEIEESIKPFLLMNIEFILDDKKIKSGKFMLFTVRDFFCIFTFLDLQKNKKTVYELPYPFNIQATNNGIIFDYTLDTFCEKNIDITRAVTKFVSKKPSKFFNKKLFVQAQQSAIM